MQPDVLFVYGFTENEVTRFRPWEFQCRFQDVTVEARREYEDMVRELAGEPADRRPELLPVTMWALRVDEETPDLLARLIERFPEYKAFFIVNPTVHRVFKQHENSLQAFTAMKEVIPASWVTGLEGQPLVASFFAFRVGTNNHLWEETLVASRPA